MNQKKRLSGLLIPAHSQDATEISPLKLSSTATNLDASFLSKALELLEAQAADATVLRDHDRSMFSSPATSQVQTPAFSSPSASSMSDAAEYFEMSMTPLNQSTSGTHSRPSLSERRSSSSSSRLGYRTPPMSIILPARPVFNEQGEELVFEEAKEEPVKAFNFNMEPLSKLEQISIEEAHQSQIAKASQMRRIKSNRTLDAKLGFEING